MVAVLFCPTRWAVQPLRGAELIWTSERAHLVVDNFRGKAGKLASQPLGIEPELLDRTAQGDDATPKFQQC